jgi:hypothetical protein
MLHRKHVAEKAQLQHIRRSALRMFLPEYDAFNLEKLS